MHLASLCGAPHLVWVGYDGIKLTILTNRYLQAWNPHRAPVTVLEQREWKPPAVQIYNTAANMLNSRVARADVISERTSGVQMRIQLLTSGSDADSPAARAYWAALETALGAVKVPVERISPSAWKSGQGRVAHNEVLIITDAEQAASIPQPYGVIALQHDSPDETALRLGEPRTKNAIGKRDRTIWVASSEWVAHFCHAHTGIVTERIIFGAVDPNTFFPSERQRLRSTERPVILHRCTDKNGGSEDIEQIAKLLADSFDVRTLSCGAGQVAETLRSADIWLNLDASGVFAMPTPQAMATDMVVLSTDVGPCWLNEKHLALDEARPGAWLESGRGIVVFDWRWRSRAEDVAAWVRTAWQQAKNLHPRNCSRRWFGPALFAQKWVELILAAVKRFNLDSQPAQPNPQPNPSNAGHPPRSQRER